MVEEESLKVSILTLNVLSENYINKVDLKKYRYQDRYLFLLNWLNSKILEGKTIPDIIFLQEFDQELWSYFRKKSDEEKSKSKSMFDNYLFVYTYFDRDKVQIFKESIFKIIRSAGITELPTLNFFSDVVHPGMVIGINIKKFKIITSCQQEFTQD